MSDQAPESLYSNLKALTRVIAIGIPLIGAIPTATNIYYGLKYDIPWWEVPHQAEQAKLWAKNAECRPHYRALSTGTDTVVYVASCPTTHDISLKISVPGRDSVYEWIAFSSLRKPGETPSFWNRLIPIAHAAAEGAQDPRNAMRLAQATSQVVCQSRVGAKIVRIIREGNRCFRETFSPYKGRVEKREEVPCTTSCPAPGNR